MRGTGRIAVVAVLVVGAGVAACRSEDKTSVSFTSPKDGATVSSPVKVAMAAKGITIEPAGQVNPNAGHFHVLVDRPCLKKGQPLPITQGVNHFGKAQTSTDLELPAGKHTLCLQVGDGTHVALEDTDRITITVK